MRTVDTRLRALVESGVNALGFDLVDVELVGGRQHQTLRVYIDSRGGITVDDCADVSRHVSAILDVEDPLPGSYTLEVSSPGLDRPLVTRADFERYCGEIVKVRTHAPVAGRRNFTGRLLEVAGEGVAIEVGPLPGGVMERFDLALADIERARLVPKL
ncbi:MAG: ribosome maturation factor RimP [Gammaproteobacteria bacterium]